LNPRTLPTLTAGENQLEYRAGAQVRDELPWVLSQYKEAAFKANRVEYTSQGGEGYLINSPAQSGEVIFELSAKPGSQLSGFDAGGRFLDLRAGIAPSKFTAETRKVTPWPAANAGAGTASISWSINPDGPWTTLWTYDPKLNWLDGQPINQVLRWPEVDRKVRDLPAGTKRAYVRYEIQGLAFDQLRLATISPVTQPASQHLLITHVWEEDGKQHEFKKELNDPQTAQQYQVSISKQASVENVALILDCPQ
jgi:hypothetical protein